VELGSKHRPARLGLLGFAAFVASEATARGAPVATQLEYRAADGCPAAGDFAAVVAARLGYEPFLADAALRVVVQIDASGRALEGRLEWFDARGTSVGEHTFPSRTGDCGELARAMEFALALQIQLMAAAVAAPDVRRPGAAPGNGSTIASPTAVQPAAGVLSTPRTTNGGPEITKPTRLSRPWLAVGTGASVGLGVAPSAVALGRLFVTVGWSRVALELGAEASVPSVTHLANGTGFSQQEVLGGLAGCGMHRAWSACLVGKVGEIRVVGQAIDVPATSSALMVQGGLRLAMTQPLGRRLQLVAHGEGLAVLTRGVVTLDSMPVWTTPRFAALFGIDLGVRFW
jgi:hypothetical protein